MTKTDVTTPTAPTGPGVKPTQAAQVVEVMRVLHLEDNAADAMLMQEYIRDVLPDVKFDSVIRLSDVTLQRVLAAHCALVDLSLPDASGLEALLALRRMSEKLPIIVLTGFDNLELGLSAVRFGADDYLIKNHVDGYTLERAIKYSIERRRLMLDLAKAEDATVVATADTIAADAAASAAVEVSTVSAGRPGMPTPVRTAPGTHEVSVRVDEKTGEYALSCRSCDWVAKRGLDDLHSWSARSLDEVLLHHVGQEVGSEPVGAAGPAVQRRGVFRPRGWVG